VIALREHLLDKVPSYWRPRRRRVKRRGRGAGEAEAGGEGGAHTPIPTYGAAQSQVGWRAIGTEGDTGGGGQGRWLVEKSHVLLRCGRRMLLEGRKRGRTHQPAALRSTQRGEAWDDGGRLSVLHDDDGGRGQGRSLEDQMRLRELAELIVEATASPLK